MNPHQPRYHHLDALRAFAMLLGIVFHALLSFVEVPLWPAQDIGRSDAHYSFFQHAIHGFRMPMFFLVSGFFTAMLWRRHGSAGLIGQRAKRIALPLLIGTLTAWPLLITIGIRGAAKKAQIETSQSYAKSAAAPTDLWGAAKAGDLEVIRSLLERGNDPNRRDRFGISPLTWAALHGHPEAATALIDGGAEVDNRDAKGGTALHAAALLSRADVAQCLIDRGAALNAVNDAGETPLDRSHAHHNLVAAIAGLIQMEVDTGEVSRGRESTWALLAALDAESASELSSEEIRRQGGSGWGALFKLYLLGAMFPAFHHLWFLYYLCWLVGLFLCATWLWERLPIRIPVRTLATPICLVYLIPLTFLPQMMFWQSFGPDTAPGILPWPPKLFYYAIFFGFGAACSGRTQFEQRAGRHWIVWLAAALAILVVGLKAYHGGHHVVASAFAAAYAWLMIFACLGLSRRFFSAENPRVRYLSDSAYWLYLAHLPLVMAMQIVVSDWPLPGPVKLAIVSASSISLLLLSYRYWVRYTFIGKTLNGERVRPVTAKSPTPGLPAANTKIANRTS